MTLCNVEGKTPQQKGSYEWMKYEYVKKAPTYFSVLTDRNDEWLVIIWGLDFKLHGFIQYCNSEMMYEVLLLGSILLFFELGLFWER